MYVILAVASFSVKEPGYSYSCRLPVLIDHRSAGVVPSFADRVFSECLV